MSSEYTVPACWVTELRPVPAGGDTSRLGALRAGSHFMPAGVIGQHLVRWVGRGRGEGRPSGNMTPKTKVSTGGQWALGAVACLLLLLFSSNSFFEVSPTPKDDANRSLSLLWGTLHTTSHPQTIAHNRPLLHRQDPLGRTRHLEQEKQEIRFKPTDML